MRYDSKAEVKEYVALNSQTINTDTTTDGVKIDTQGYDGCIFLTQMAGYTLGTATPLIQDSDDNSVFADVTDTFLSGTEAGAALTVTNTISRIGYVGKKRYVRLSIVSSDSANYVIAGACILTKAKEVPTT